MMQFPDVLKLGHTCLRPMQAGDLAAVTEQLGAPDTAQWLAAVSSPFTASDAADLLAFAQEPLHLVRVIEQADAMVGCIALRPSLWFWLAPAQRQSGLMRRCLAAAIATCFARPAPPLTATVRADNVASLALLRALGFSPMPEARRMFFRSTGTAQPCIDHLMTPEQWHMLHPPRIELEGYTLRPAGQKDAMAVSTFLRTLRPSLGHSADNAGEVSEFIEQQRCRAPGKGLFIVEGSARNSCGALLLDTGAVVAAHAFASTKDKQAFFATWRARAAAP